jgi:hypothetical protein
MNSENFKDETDVQKCRCCFRILIEPNYNTVKINKVIQERFYELTGIEVRLI